MSAKQEMHPHRVTQVVEKCSRCEKILERQEQNVALWKRACFWAAITFFVPLLVWGISRVLGAYVPSSPEPKPRTTKCYFVRHQRYEDNDKHSQPWDPWHVFESQKEGGHNQAATSEAFKTKEAAWGFIQKWNLEPCR